MSNSYWGAYEAQMYADGRTERERQIAKEKRTIQQLSPKSLSTETALVNEKPMKLNIVASKSKTLKTINTIYNGDTLRLGDIVVWKSAHWLITDLDIDDTLYYKATMTLCSCQICWQNPSTKEIVYRWAVFSKPYSSTVGKSEMVNTSERQFNITLVADEETLNVELQKRFIFEKINGHPKVYNLTGIDSFTGRYSDIGGGTLKWTVEQGEYNELTDNAELMIADYLTPDEPVPTDYHIKADEDIKIGGQRKCFTLQLANTNVKNHLWRVTVLPEFEKYINAVIEDGKLYVNVLQNREMNGTQAKIQALDADENELCSVFVKVVNIY